MGRLGLCVTGNGGTPSDFVGFGVRVWRVGLGLRMT